MKTLLPNALARNNFYLCNRRLRAIIQLTIIFLLCSFSSLGQDLDDFKKAASGSGIDAIPYPDLERKVSDLQSDKDRAFSACSGYKGRALYESKKNSVRIKKEMTEDLEEAKEKLDDDDGESSSVTNSLKSKVEDLEEKLEDITEELEEMDKKINEGLKRWRALLEIRMEIGEVYADVKKRLSSSKSSPNKHIDKPSSSDTAAMEQYEKDVETLKDYIDDIDDTIDDGTYKHKKPIEEAEKAIKWLEDAQDLK